MIKTYESIGGRRYIVEKSEHAIRALEAIQEAQNLIALACRELSTVNGMGNVYSETCKLHDKVKGHWHAVNNRAIDVAPKTQDINVLPPRIG